MPRKPHCYFYIYKTTNLLNNQFYIGMHCTSNLEDGYLGSGDRLRRSIRKYGKENFKKEILEFCTDKFELAKRESEIVNYDLIKEDLCMNLKPGGFGGWASHKENPHILEKVLKTKSLWTEEYKKELYSKISLSNKGKHKDNKWLGKNHSNETKLKISLANKGIGIGKDNTQFGKKFKVINNGLINKKCILSQLEEYLNNGWILGTLNKKFYVEHPQFGMKFNWINNGIINKKIQVQYLQEYLDNNWILGRLNFKKSNDKLRKLNKILSNKKFGGKGENNPQFGKVWIYNLDLKLCKSIFSDELENYLNQNWIKGRKMKF